MLAYPGVLLSTTSIPIWARTRLLGALLGASSMASAASALSICAALDPSSEDTARSAIQRIEVAAHTVEALALAGYVYTEGLAARPLLRGRYSNMFRFGAFAAGIVLPAIITMARPKHNRSSALISGALSIAGALALKWSIVHAGHDSAVDGAINRDTTRATPAHPGWLPSTDVRTGVLAGG
jgi:formate-dependent nitrite reductase membrane component NrfD